MSKVIRKFLFARKSHLDGRGVFASVEAFDKDHAVKRLGEKYPHIESKEWDFLEELDPDHYVGKIGEDIPLIEKSPISTAVAAAYLYTPHGKKIVH